MIVVVTGATGFVGSHVARALVTRGHEVRALVRSPSAALPVGARRIVVPDAWTRTSLDDACAGADAVVHVAGLAHQRSRGDAGVLEQMRAVNVEGTRTLAHAAAGNGVRRFVFMSSVAAGDTPRDCPLDESPAFRPSTPYGQSKLEAEAVCAEVMAQIGGRSVAVRPPMIYGPGMRGAPLDLFGLIQRGIPLPLEGVRQRLSVASVQNVTAATLFLLDDARTSGGYLVADDDVPTVEELTRAVGAALGKPTRLLPLPVAVIRAAARVGDVIARLTRFPLTTERLDRVLGTVVVDTTRLRTAGFVPPVSMRDGLVEAARWFAVRGPA